ncbi:hypothetical protein KC19_3G139000 [Ceratodon purpureus]|uniref:demethylphylloquinone reductase n=1 Tax=Ceratodon purpureus TaxID=3225 RepID=A0A8T0ILY8_CERPU|nr:hypothetical protein KC19_3G139000 [Ceratodon purpureus]
MALTLVQLSPVASLSSSRHPGGICEKQGPSVSPILQACTTRLVSSAGQVQMSSQEQKKGLRSLFLSSFKLCQPLMAFQAASMSTVMAAYAAGGSAGNSAVLDDGGAGLTSFVWSDPKRPRICVLGGGFGGLYTALRLESLIWPPDKKPQIVLVDQCDRFVFKPLLYELLSKEVESWEVAPTFKDLLANSSVQFRQDTVKSIQPFDAVNGTPALATTSRDVGGSVYLSSGMQVDYDWLVLALGSEPRMNFVPGASELAVPFSTLEDALEVDRRLVALEKYASPVTPAEVVVVGSGYCGIELAATLAERLGNKGRIKVVDMASDIVASAPAGNREAASKVLSSRNVELVLGYSVANMSSIEGISVEGNISDRVRLELQQPSQRPSRRAPPGQTIEVDLVLWTAGTQVSIPPSETQSGYQSFPVNGRGQADTDEMLRVKGHPRIFALGDSAGTTDASGRTLPSTAQVAFQQADYAGWNLWAAINNRPLLPFRYQHLGEMMTLGTNDGAVSVSFIEGITLDGFLGHTARKLAYLYRLPTNEHKAKVGLSWLTKSTVSSISFLQETISNTLIETADSILK